MSYTKTLYLNIFTTYMITAHVNTPIINSNQEEDNSSFTYELPIDF